MAELTERGIIEHVKKYGKYVKQIPDKPYHVHWKGASIYSADTRDLVLQICKIEGIEADPVLQCEEYDCKHYDTCPCRTCRKSATCEECCKVETCETRDPIKGCEGVTA